MPDRAEGNDKASGITAAGVDQRPVREGLSTENFTRAKTKDWIDTTLSEIGKEPPDAETPELKRKRRRKLRLRPTVLDDLKLTYVLWTPWALGAGILLYLELLIDLKLSLMNWTVPSVTVGALVMFFVSSKIRKPLSLLVAILIGLIAAEHRVTSLPPCPLKSPTALKRQKPLFWNSKAKRGAFELMFEQWTKLNSQMDASLTSFVCGVALTLTIALAQLSP